MTLKKTHTMRMMEKRQRIIALMWEARNEYPEAAVTALIQTVAARVGWTRVGVLNMLRRMGVYEELKAQQQQQRKECEAV